MATAGRRIQGLRPGDFAECRGPELRRDGSQLVMETRLGFLPVKVIIPENVASDFKLETGQLLCETPKFYVSGLSCIVRERGLDLLAHQRRGARLAITMDYGDELLLSDDVRAMRYARTIGLEAPKASKQIQAPILKQRDTTYGVLMSHPFMFKGVRDIYTRKRDVLESILSTGTFHCSDSTFNALFRKRERDEIQEYCSTEEHVHQRLMAFTDHMLKAAKGTLLREDVAAISERFDNTTAAKLTIVCNDRNAGTGRPTLDENDETRALRRYILERAPQVRAILGFVRVLDGLKDKKFKSSQEFVEKATSFGEFASWWFNGLDERVRLSLIQYAVGTNERIRLPSKGNGAEGYLDSWFNELPANTKWRDFIGGWFVQKKLREEANRLTMEIKRSRVESDKKGKQT